MSIAIAPPFAFPSAIDLGCRSGGPTYWTGSVPTGEKGKGVEQTGCGAHPGFSPASDSCNTYKIPGGDGHAPTIGYNMGGGANNWPLAQHLLSAF